MRLWIYPCLLAVLPSITSATEMVYRFENPRFGGNPLNGSFLLNQASEQNTFKDSTAQSSQRTPIDRFKDTLQSAILSQVSRATTRDLVDEDGNLQLGTNLNFDLDGDGESDFSVQVSDALVNGNVNISISDGITDTTLTVPYVTSSTAP